VWHSETRADGISYEIVEVTLRPSHLPRSLSYCLASAGFRLYGATVFPILNLEWNDDNYSKGLAGTIEDFVSRKNALPSEDLKEWYGEFVPLSEAGQYFFSTNRYIFRVSKPID
jgi:hypothetical protein